MVAYHRPQKPKWMSKAEHASYPGMILVRHLKYKIHQRGLRTCEETLANTLLDEATYKAEELAELSGVRLQR
jgi:putative transposase